MRAIGSRKMACLLASAAGFSCWGVFCPTATIPGTTNRPAVILLEIINESGVDAAVTAVFHVGGNPVRETTRLLAATGPGSTDLIVPTTTEEIHIVARQVDPPPAARVGDLLADERIVLDDDVEPGDTITFIIRAYGFEDCNDNGIDDRIDVAEGVSEDCNLNGRPDECDSPRPIVVVIGEYRRVIKTDPLGASPETLVDLSSYGLGSLRKMALDVDGGSVFFTAAASISDGTVNRAPLEGGTPVQLITSQQEIGGVGLDAAAGKMYWSSSITSPPGVRIASAGIDGSNETDVITGLAGLVAKPQPDPLNAVLYFTFNPTAGTDDFIRRSEYDGSNVLSIIGNATDPRDVAVWVLGGLLVWAEYGESGGVFTAELGGNSVVWIAAAASATGVAIDPHNCRIYWSVEGTIGLSNGFVERSRFDGSGVVRVLDGLDAPQDVEIFAAGSP